MSSTPDLFVVCSQCGSEVSPYVTECPYCGHRLRKRAPNLPRERIPSRSPRGLGGLVGRVRRPPLAPARVRSRQRGSGVGLLTGAGAPPRATVALISMSAVGWVLWHARPSYLVEATILGPLGGHWWRLLTSEFAYFNGLYAFVTLLAIAVFGWLVERRHGPAVVLALFFGAGVAGALVTIAVYPVPVVTGANGAALALLAAWAGPDLLALRSGDYYEGDLLGAAAFAVVLLALPFLVYYVSWIDGLIGGAIGLLAGRGLAGVGEPAL